MMQERSGTHVTAIFAALILATLLSTAIVPFSQQASGAPVTTLSVSDPKYGSAPVYVNLLTEFTLTVSETADIWYKWSDYNYTRYTGPFIAEAFLESQGGAPALPIDLEGLQTLYYNASGEAPKSAQFYVDINHPETSFQFIGNYYSGDYHYIESATQIKLTASDSGSGLAEIIYAVDNGPDTVYTAPFTISGLGMSTVFYSSVDRLGNSEPEKRLTVSVDNEPPLVNIIAGDPKANNAGITYITGSTPISLSAEDISGVASLSYKIDGGAWRPYSEPFTITSEGSHTVYAKASDFLGHTSAEISLTITVDTTAPSVSIPGSSGGALSLEYGSILTIQCTDSGVGGCKVYYSFTGDSPWTEYTVPITMLNSNNITFYAVDGVGNTAAQSVVRVIVNSQGDGSQSQASSWRLYVGVGLIIGGILVAVISLMSAKADMDGGKKAKRGRREEKPETKKKTKRNR